MKAYKCSFSGLTALIMAMIIVLSCMVPAFAAYDNTTAAKAKQLTLGKKVSFTLDAQNDNQSVWRIFYKVKITKKGIYKLSIYDDINEYGDNAENVCVELYSSAKSAQKSSGYDSINFERRYSDGDALCTYYRLKKGTYYLSVENNKGNSKVKSGIKIESQDDPYFIDWFGDIYWSQKMQLGLRNLDGYEVKKVTSVKSSDETIIKTKKGDYEIELYGKKIGEARITVKYVGQNGKKGTFSKTFKVKKYPNAIKSLKVNGKKVDLKKNRFEYSVKTNKTKVAVKIDVKDGWEVNYVNFELIGKSNKFIEGSKAKKYVTKGTSVSFPKKYSGINFLIQLRKKNGRERDSFTYCVFISR